MIRRVKTVCGEVRFRMVLAPRFDYARASYSVEQAPGEVLFVSRGKDKTAVRLRSSVPVEINNGDAVAEFMLRVGGNAIFILEHAYSGQKP